MNEIPIINHIPEKYRGIVVLIIMASPYVTRAYHALASGGGLRGIFAAIWLGTNVPKDLQNQTTETKTDTTIVKKP